MTIDDNERAIERDRESKNDQHDDHPEKDVDNNRWRDLCRMVAEEKNPTRMSALLDELIAALDQRRRKFLQDAPTDNSSFRSDLLPGMEET